MKIDSIIINNKFQDKYNGNSIKFSAKLPPDLFQISSEYNNNSISQIVDKYINNFNKPVFDYQEFEEAVIKMNKYFSAINDTQSLKKLYRARNPYNGQTIAHVAKAGLIKNINDTFKIDPAFLVEIYSQDDNNGFTPLHSKTAGIIREINNGMLNNKPALKGAYFQKTSAEGKTPLHFANAIELAEINNTFKTNKEFMFKLHTNPDNSGKYPIHGKSAAFYTELFKYYNSDDDIEKLNAILLPENMSSPLLESFDNHPSQIEAFYDAFISHPQLLKDCLLSEGKSGLDWSKPERLNFAKLAQIFENEPKMLAQIYSAPDVNGITPAFLALKNGDSESVQIIHNIIGDKELLKKAYMASSEEFGTVVSNFKSYETDYSILHELFRGDEEKLLDLYIAQNSSNPRVERIILRTKNIAPILELTKGNPKLLKKLITSQDTYGNNLLHYKLSSECADIYSNKDDSIKLILDEVEKYPEILKEALSAENLEKHIPIQLYNRRGDISNFFDRICEIFKDDPKFLVEICTKENIQNFSMFHLLSAEQLQKIHEFAKDNIESIKQIKSMHMINHSFNGYIAGSSVDKLIETARFFENDPEFLAELFLLLKKNQGGSKEYADVRNEIIKKILADPELNDEKSLELAAAYKEQDLYISLIYNYLATKQ